MFRFTIRDVLWLMALVGMGCEWWVDHRYLTAPKWDDDGCDRFLSDIWIDPGVIGVASVGDETEMYCR